MSRREAVYEVTLMPGRWEYNIRGIAMAVEKLRRQKVAIPVDIKPQAIEPADNLNLADALRKHRTETLEPRQIWLPLARWLEGPVNVREILEVPVVVTMPLPGVRQNALVLSWKAMRR